MKYRVIAKKLKQLGCREIVERRSGSHRIWMNPQTETEASIPDWRNKDLKIGTLRSILNQLEVDYQKFVNR